MGVRLSNIRSNVGCQCSQSGCRVLCNGQRKLHDLPAPAALWVQQHANQGRHGASGGAVASHQLPDGQRGFDAHLGTPPAVRGAVPALRGKACPCQERAAQAHPLRTRVHAGSARADTQPHPRAPDQRGRVDDHLRRGVGRMRSKLPCTVTCCRRAPWGRRRSRWHHSASGRGVTSSTWEGKKCKAGAGLCKGHAAPQRLRLGRHL